MQDPIFVSVIVPCRNEEKYISTLLENLKSQDYPFDYIEFLIVDGQSDDKTRDLIADLQKSDKRIKLISNPERTVPFALNKGIKSAKGEIIIRMDAHSEYPDNYISILVKHLVELNADNVGGVWIIKPGDESSKSIAVARAISHPFGSGNAQYKITNNKEVRQVDTVPYGCYKKQIFNQIGMFDEELTRNQDDEFNSRLLKNGGKIFLIPTLEIIYYARGTFKKLWQMNYQYGYFKPLVGKKIGRPTSIRQLIPSLFILYIVISGIFSLVNPSFWLLNFFTFIYILLNLFFSFKISVKEKRFIFFQTFLSFLIAHFGYGVGYLKGILDFIFFKKKNKSVNLSR